MKRTTLFLLCAAIAVLGCGEVDEQIVEPPEPVRFKDLSEPWHVLHNLQTAYNQRNELEYERMLDDDFLFFFSDDVPIGPWDRAIDVPATRHLLQDALTMNVGLDFQTAVWDTIHLPGDTLLATTVNYEFVMRFGRDPETTWEVPGNPTARFTVHEVDVDGQKQWRLVEWRDFGNEGVIIIPPGSPLHATLAQRVNGR